MKNWKLLLAVITLLTVAGVEGWEFKRRSERVCRSALALASQANRVSEWVAEAAEDPFLGVNALRGPMMGLLSEYRERSGRIASELSVAFLPDGAYESFHALSREASESPKFAVALRALVPLASSLQCAPSDASAEADPILKLVDESAAIWQDQRAYAAASKVEFERDRGIYCRAELLEEGLKRVLESAAASCRQSYEKDELVKICLSGGGAALELELKDLEKQKLFNLGKLRAKWPEAVVKRIQCSPS